MTEGFADINGAHIYYEVAGEGHPLAFVHAGIANNHMWDDQFYEFAKRYRVIRHDMRGYGQSEPVDGEYSNREDLYALLKFLNVERTYLVGCSMGGGACMDVTLEHPDMVDALVMVGSAPRGLELDTPDSPLEPEIMAADKAKDWDRLCELETRLWFDGEGRTPQDVDASARARLWEMNRRVIELSSRGLGTAAPPLTPVAAERLADLHLPVLVIYGDRDEQYIVQAADYMEQHIAGAQKVLMPNTAHIPNMERPAEFNQIVLNFLEKLN